MIAFKTLRESILSNATIPEDIVIKSKFYKKLLKNYDNKLNE